MNNYFMFLNSMQPKRHYYPDLQICPCDAHSFSMHLSAYLLSYFIVNILGIGSQLFAEKSNMTSQKVSSLWQILLACDRATGSPVIQASFTGIRVRIKPSSTSA